MAKSEREFSRWLSREPSWPFRVFQKHNRELSNLFIAHILSHKTLYKNLDKEASWADHLKDHFPIEEDEYELNFQTLKDWSDSYNEFDNWVNLNSVMAMTSNFETYLSTIIQLALESDVGVLFGAPRTIDGIEIVKYGREQPFDFEEQVLACTKGEWNSRINAYQKIFGQVPDLLQNSISRLERIRKLRNNVGHAFGRDIQRSRSHDVIEIEKMQKLSRERCITYQKSIFGIARSIESHLMTTHIGEYQALHFYHKLRPTLKSEDDNYARQLGNHMAILKKKLGQFGAAAAGKTFCKGLIEYYEGL